MLKYVFFIVFSIPLFAQTIFTYQPKSNDFKKDYDYDLLQLALEKTKKKYGEYKLIPTKNMNAKRRLKILESNQLENYIIKRSYSSKMLEKLDYVPIPVDRGVVGYRLFLVYPKKAHEIKTIQSLDELKKYKMVQGIGWLDTKILKYNGLKVHEGTNYQGLFTMVAGGRVDLYPFGVNNIYRAYERHKDKNLHINENLALYYPLPRFFFMHKSNQEALKRVKEGLEMAFEDGSFIKLWNSYYAFSLEKANLKQRIVFKLNNPYLDRINTSYEKYLYRP